MVALVGHRRNKLSAKNMEDLPGRLSSLFTSIDTAADGDEVALLTGMADGTDLIGAAVRPPGWSLVAILAEPPEAIACRMREADAAEMLRLCAEPGASIEVLHGQFDDYHRQSGVILSRANLLVAVWDGDLGRGAGGTADSVARAEALGLPVVVLSPEAREARWNGNAKRPVNASTIAAVFRKD